MHDRTERVIRKYLKQHAPHASDIARSLPGYERAVVVPSYGEGVLTPLHESLTRAVRDLERPSLLVLVLNEPPDATREKRTSNEETRGWFLELEGEQSSLRDDITLNRRSDGLDLLLVERTARTMPIAIKRGVGEARAIGADQVLALFAQGKLRNPLIYTTDGDARVPTDYFDHSVEPGAAGCVFPYVHEPVGDDHPAITCYELALRYYVEGLQFAESPYALHTVGSSMAVHANAYARVRGVPRRNAAEDFYLLNKVRKLGPIPTVPSGPIVLSGRASDRVPFGTGRSVADFVASGATADEYPLYDPRCFIAVREALRFAHDARASSDDLLATLKRHFANDAAEVHRIVSQLGVFDARARALANTQSPEAFARHIDTFFDAFVTRKLVHSLRDAVFASRPVMAALDAAPFIEPLRPELGDASVSLRLQQLRERQIPGYPPVVV